MYLCTSWFLQPVEQYSTLLYCTVLYNNYCTRPYACPPVYHYSYAAAAPPLAPPACMLHEAGRRGKICGGGGVWSSSGQKPAYDCTTYLQCGRTCARTITGGGDGNPHTFNPLRNSEDIINATIKTFELSLWKENLNKIYKLNPQTRLFIHKRSPRRLNDFQ